MSSRPSRPDTREINSQVGLEFAGDHSNCSGLVSDFLTIPAGSPSSTSGVVKAPGRRSTYARPGTSCRAVPPGSPAQRICRLDVIRVRGHRW